MLATTAQAQVPSTVDSEEQRRRTQEQYQQRMRQTEEPVVKLADGEYVAEQALQLPAESPCFPIKQIHLQLPEQLSESVRAAGAFALPQDKLHFAHSYLQNYVGTCIGKQGLNLIVQGLGALILVRGYSTTRIGIPEQDLSSGTLRLSLIPGMIRRIHIKDAQIRTSTRSTFPGQAGTLLNLRDLEQGLEQLKRVPSLDVEMQIIPGDTAGESDVLLDIVQGKPWKVSVTLDDSGSRSTGKWQAGVQVALDQPLGLADIFSFGFNSDADRASDRRSTSGNHFYYALPFGYTELAFAGSSYDYQQKIAGQEADFIWSGRSKNLDVRLSQVFQRDQMQKNTWQFKTGKRWSRAYANDAELGNQQRHTSFAELSWLHKHYFGRAQLDFNLTQRWGVNWFNGQADPPAELRKDDDGSFRYSLQTIDASFIAPFQFARHSLSWMSSLRAQYSNARLYASDQFSIGNRYTVRGFDGELSLAAERGFFLRNEVKLALGGSGTSLYLGLDLGKVSGPARSKLAGDKLAGTALGLRGAWGGLQYDIFSAWSLYQPSHFPSASPVAGINLSWQY
ncbi:MULTISPECIES: ShlB/FhaC/HecB family hemolysin secretion/activation protein [unclassified Undibacterium]|uniref:ShlB/FhaC/HecB family hemolysin secretion/activation protein n=1 Tax=unclassified Undibacterium TaxID=2630295 RepID=UPI002AC8F625|nr:MULTISPECIES: ShlB/FhaC/HecB family hemolysin secretion/activation protein [unclassified Undibacterium]MEB0140670.1 ShlB/FhaC/HecB family hemolysin secretion/activation protein [Undibacterium sp. CCC2.1]MEB0173870.1 ShlB/FhaC/HecB family hemolysin secretion/activation protein [Undibacterium sp. CCC1.1]MEB0177705.1 ShlB/FhaC/HecB family hemolysin secretion/activation protein [Undibacterium sp. CCC3.4]MEB0216853.1 ShlB/FhaC/HecB family hemolysin secretion/activation protein [Undibacterium sp. 